MLFVRIRLTTFSTLTDRRAEKLLTQLKGQEWSTFAEPVKLQVILLKKIMYPGKQITSVEKLLYAGQIPPQHQIPGLYPTPVDTLKNLIQPRAAHGQSLMLILLTVQVKESPAATLLVPSHRLRHDHSI